MAELAIKSSEVTNLEVSGVDILETPNGLQVIEVNSIPGWKGLQQVVPIDIPARVVDYLLGKIKK
jgi:glutathione synthase/RimK-type ligase-like ATP-grasp enzyme